jgi:CO/xanthine dehydrogenase Mo-binding subunit
VLISEYTGGGFGSKIPGAQSMAIPALMSKKLNGRPVMMRISRAEETYIGRVRPGYQGWIKMGFKKDGRVTAIDTFIVEASGPYRRQGDHSTTANLGRCCSRRRTCASAASRSRPTRRRACRSARRADCRRRCGSSRSCMKRRRSSASIRSRFAR